MFKQLLVNYLNMPSISKTNKNHAKKAALTSH